VITSVAAIDPANLALPVIRKLSTKVSTVPVARQLIALATDRMWESVSRQKVRRVLAPDLS
jgi:hypothetical protein